MNSQIRLLAGLALACQLSALPVIAEETGTHRLSEWKFGKVLFGERIIKGELKGKVVVIENWGVHCPPCIASLPHLAELDQKNREKGLRIIGAESQGSTKEQIKPLIEKAKVEYTITSGAEGPIQFSAIPRAFVFGPDGKLVFDGHPADEGFVKAIDSALTEVKSAPPPAASAATGPLIPIQAWTNTEGREIRAAVKKADDTTVTFQMADGREIVYQLSKLSEGSRQAITEALKTR